MSRTVDYGRSRARGAQAPLILIVAVLCVSVIAYMLGVPVTLLAPSADVDTTAASALEGFSIPSALHQLDLPVKRSSYVGVQQALHVPVLASAPFHPPVL